MLSYGPDFADNFRRAATYVDRILRGEKPGDLPVQFPTKFEMVLNLKTAKALGLTIPRSILLAPTRSSNNHPFLLRCMSSLCVGFSDAGMT